MKSRNMKSRISAYEAKQKAARSKDDGEYESTESGQDDRKSRIQDKSEGTYGSVSVPHTTAASKFIYGYSSVLAALKAKQRRIYKLYYHPRARRRASSPLQKENEQKEQDTILALASEQGQTVQIKQVDDDFLRVMDKISEDRPHNSWRSSNDHPKGIVLETSPLPFKPVEHFGPVTRLKPWFIAQLRGQSPEQKMINGTDDRIRFESHGWRYPIVLFLHNITDSGNLGAIIRSAHYLGVDAIAMATRNTASVDDPVVIKASAGATEATRILQIPNPFKFLSDSGNNGWRVYAAEAPPPLAENLSFTEDITPAALDAQNTSPLVSFRRTLPNIPVYNHNPLARHPTILMMGGEHSGIDAKLKTRAHYQVGVRGVQTLDVGVDSLNVSVASALIMLEMLKKPANVKAAKKDPKAGANFLF
ncbi:Alpha/beta knot methyltransferase [Phyllosticta capitalensis]